MKYNAFVRPGCLHVRAAACLAIPALDAILAGRASGLAVRALLDEAAHLATTVVMLAILPAPLDRRVCAGALAGSVLLDVDHVPMTLRHRGSLEGLDRPATHSIAGVLVMLGITTLLHRPARPYRLGAVFGMTTHLLRDAATGGASLKQPLSGHEVEIPYRAYAALLAACLVIEAAKRLSAGWEARSN